MSVITNGSIAVGGTAQNILADGHSINAIIFVNESETDAVRVNIGATASAAAGEKIYPKSTATFNNLNGQRVSVYCASVGQAYSYREAL